MLTVPAFRTIADTTIFRDDALWYKFYPIYAYPSVRLDKNGNPVFFMAKYAFSDQDRESNPKLPPGGGYLNFDIQFDVPATVLATVRTELQEWVNQEWTRLQNGTAAEKALPGVANTTEPPTIEFGAPTWTAGAVSMDAPQSEMLVSHRVASGAPSLLSGNIAVFSMDLTHEGATFMQRVLVGDDGSSGSDLTPVQVKYDLSFWARLPKASIHISANSEKIHEHVRKIMDGEGTDHCTTYDFAYTDIDTRTAHMAGLIEVQIDNGSGSLSEETMDALREYALDMVQQMIESSFFTDQPPLGEGPGTDDGDLANTTTGKSQNAKKFYLQQYDSATMTIELHLEQSSVVEWPVHPQATLSTFFRGLTGEQLKQYVRTVDLDDDFFKHLGLEVRAIADYGDAALDLVEVDVRYEGVDENGDRQEKNQTFTFTSIEPQTWNPSLIGDARDYDYRYRVSFRDHGFGPYTEWVSSSSPDLNISIPTPGRVRLAVQAGHIDFEQLVENVQVTLAYEDVAAAVARQEQTVSLNASRREASYERLIYTFPTQPVQFKRRFVMKSGEVIEDGAWQTTVNQQLLINQPFTDLLRVRLLPTGDGWEELSQAVVDLRYQDFANQYTVEESLILKSRDEFRTWQVVLRDKTNTRYSYRVSASFKNGRFSQTPWLHSEGEATIPIEIKAQPGLKVQLFPDRLDFAASPITEITLNYAAAGVQASETFVFRSKEAQTWRVATPDAAPVQYRYQITHYPNGNGPVLLPEMMEQDTAVILPPYRPPEAGSLTVTLMAQLVDFTATPIVVVDLDYLDEVNNVHQVGAVTFTAVNSQTWVIPVKDINRKHFSYTLTYYTADGQEHRQPTQVQPMPRVIIPRYQTV